MYVILTAALNLDKPRFKWLLCQRVRAALRKASTGEWAALGVLGHQFLRAFKQRLTAHPGKISYRASERGMEGGAWMFSQKLSNPKVTVTCLQFKEVPAKGHTGQEGDDLPLGGVT